MSQIVIAACRRYPELSVSNRILAEALRRAGAQVSTALWNRDAAEVFTDADLVILRQTWDYQADPGGFAAWLSGLSRRDARIRNAPELAVWNNDKRTLCELGVLGIAIPATVPIIDGTDFDPASIPTDQIVVKPVFGGSGVGVFITSQTGFEQDFAAAALASPGTLWMAQEYLPEIADGEWKLTCFGGEAGFAVHIEPQMDDFRLNSRFQPKTTAKEAPDAARAAARCVSDAFGDALLCFRIDGVMRGDDFICTELELTDPDLHLHVVETERADALASEVLAASRM